MNKTKQPLIKYHLPGLFEFYDFYLKFLPLYREHREYFYEWCTIGSIYGAPADCLWGGGRTGSGDADSKAVINLMQQNDISPRLTFSNSLLEEIHLADKKCNNLCRLFEKTQVQSGIIIHSQLLLEYIKQNYPAFYFVSSTTKVITDFKLFCKELDCPDYSFVVPDFRLNKDLKELNGLTQQQKNKVEFLCNECCWPGCKDRKACYENVSRKNLGEACPEHTCSAKDGQMGYRFSKAMQNPEFISLEDIQKVYAPAGFTNFKIEGRSLGSAVLLEFLLYYLTKPDYHLIVREEMYLDCMLDLF